MRISVNPESIGLSSSTHLRLHRRPAASTVYLGHSRKHSKNRLNSPTGPIKATWRPKNIKKKPSNSPIKLVKSFSPVSKIKSSLSKRGAEDELKDLKKAIQLSEVKSAKLRDKIDRFEYMFGLLWKVLEEGEGTDELKKLSESIKKELSFKRREKGKKLCKSESLMRLPKKNVLHSPNKSDKRDLVGVQLNQLRNRMFYLISYLKS